MSRFLTRRVKVSLALPVAVIVLVAIVHVWNATRQVRTLRLQTTDLEVRVLLRDLEIPWDMDWSRDGWIWFSEKSGKISRFKPDSGPLQQVHFIEEVHQSPDNSGLHALALHPEFPEVPYVYVHYTYAADGSRLVRFRFDPFPARLEERTVLLDGIRASISHNGSRIVFSPDHRQLYVSLGDAFDPELAQDLSLPNGKILRINLDGSIPADNPFPGSPVWSYGHRNPQGLVMAANGHLYGAEHGGMSDDELNLIEEGGNYGFPRVKGWCDTPDEKKYCRDHAVKLPLKTWSPTYGISGIAYYDHAAIPEWRNSILAVSLKNPREREGKRLQVLKLNQSGTKVIETRDYLVDTFGRLREVLAAPDGRIFIFTSNREANFNKPRLPRPGDDKLIVLEVK